MGAAEQSGACPWRRGGGEREERGMRPSLTFFSRLRQSNPRPTQERAEEADGRGCKAPPRSPAANLPS